MTWSLQAHIVASTKGDKLDDLAETADRIHRITKHRTTNKYINSIDDTPNQVNHIQRAEIASIKYEFSEELHKIKLSNTKL